MKFITKLVAFDWHKLATQTIIRMVVAKYIKVVEEFKLVSYNIELKKIFFCVPTLYYGESPRNHNNSKSFSIGVRVDR